jgi:fatty-acyl-CoA synthase
MKANTITSLADIHAIEQAGQQRWMPFTQVFDALADVARRHGDRPALTALASADDTQPRRWTYTQLLAETGRSARLFRSLVDDGEPRVALLLPPLPEAWFALWGAETAGIACPINHALSDDHLVALLIASRANVVVTLAADHTAGDIGRRVQGLRKQCPTLQAVVTVGGSDADTVNFDTGRAQFDGSALGFDAPSDAHRIAALFHTGGTTGLPKFAQHTHGNQLNAAWGAARFYDANPTDVILNGFPLFHVAGAFVYGLSMLLTGAEIVLPPPAGWRDAAFLANAWPLIRAHRVTMLAMVPTVMTALLAAPRLPDYSQGVRLALSGGSPLPTELATRFEAEFSIPVRNILGMTECAGVIAIEPARAPRTPGSCGLPLPFSEVLADAEGVLRLRGANVGPGYTEPARNAGSFDDGWLITGDIGHIDAQGRVFVTGRAKDVIIRGAHNIDPGVIEEALMAHPQVAMAAAIGEPDEYAGELPVAFVIAKPGAAIDEGELLAFATPLIPERAAIPKRITIVTALPLTAIGKIYKPGLRLQATESVIRERLLRAGLGEQVSVQGEDRGGRIVLRFTLPGDPASADVRPRLHELMSGFALAWEIA